MLLQHPFNITISVTITALHALAGLSPTMLLIILGRHKKNWAVLKNHHVHCPDAKTSEQAIVSAVAAVVAVVVVYVSGGGGSSGMDKKTHFHRAKKTFMPLRGRATAATEHKRRSPHVYHSYRYFIPCFGRLRRTPGVVEG